MGGSGNDIARSITQTSDRGYIVAGETISVDGDVSGNHGNVDYWIVKLDSNGLMQWQKCLGGSSGDGAYSIEQTTDGGYIVAGSSGSNDGDVSGGSGFSDCWIVKINGTGGIQWQKTINYQIGLYSSSDEAYSIEQTTDGGYIVSGEADELLHFSPNCLIFKLNSSGDIQWQKILNGGYYSSAYSAKQTSDGGYIVAGYTRPYAGDGTDNNYPEQYWIIRFNSSGDSQWELLLGGSDTEIPNSIELTSDGGYIVTGYADSNDGDVSGNHGSRDYWVVKLKPDNILPVTMLPLTGKAQGKQNLLHWATATEQNNTGFEVQHSNDGFNFDKAGFVNSKAVNGNSSFELNYYFADIAFAKSNNYYRLKQIDKDGKFTYSNIVLLNDKKAPSAGTVSISPNPVKNILNIKIASANNNSTVLSVLNISGTVMFTRSAVTSNGETTLQLDVSHLSAGNYFLKIISVDGKINEVRKIIIE